MATVPQTGKVDTPETTAAKKAAAKKPVRPLAEILTTNLKRGVLANRLTPAELDQIASVATALKVLATTP